MKRNLLLLSGSKAAGGLSKGQQPGFLDWAEKWVKAFFKTDKPVLFVPYARPAGVSEEDYFAQVSARFQQMGIAVVCAPKEGVSEALLKSVGGIFIGGGHTPTLLYKLQQTGSLEVIRDAVNQGLPYMGSSAGSLIACPTIKSNNDMPCPANDVIDLGSLGLIHFQLNCHYMDDRMHDSMHQGETRDRRLRELCAFNPGVAVLGLYEGQALRVIDDHFYLWTSKHTRGLASPIFCDTDRIEIQCTPDVQHDITVFLPG